MTADGKEVEMAHKTETELTRRQFGLVAASAVTGMAAAAQLGARASATSLYLIGAVAYRRTDQHWAGYGVPLHKAFLILRAEDYLAEMGSDFRELKSPYEKSDLARFHNTFAVGPGDGYFVCCLAGATLTMPGTKTTALASLPLPNIRAIAAFFGHTPGEPKLVAPPYKLEFREGIIRKPTATTAPGSSKEWVFRKQGQDFSEADALTDISEYYRFGPISFTFARPQHDPTTVTVKDGSRAWIISGASTSGKNPNVLTHGDKYFTLYENAMSDPPQAQTVGLKYKLPKEVNLPCLRLQTARGKETEPMAEQLIPPDTEFCYQAEL